MLQKEENAQGIIIQQMQEIVDYGLILMLRLIVIMIL